MFKLLFPFLTSSLIAQNSLTPQEQRGRQIFELGTSASGGSIQALVAGDALVAGSIVPCANCHGHDGQGKPEGGVVPSNITWDALTKPYGQVHPDGRTHPMYTERLLRRAITMGLDPAGNSLSDAMPRFQLSLADAADLVAYIKRLGEGGDPGLTASSVRLGVILPSPLETGTDSRVITETLLDYFARLNTAGGIFSRKVELVWMELPQEPARRPDAVHDFLSKQNIFALVGSSFAGAESEIAAVIGKAGTPAIAAFAPFPETATPLNKYVFYLDGGVREELEALLDLAKEQFPGRDFPTTIASSDGETAREIAHWLEGNLAEAGYRRVTVSEDFQGTARGLVFWLRPDLNGLSADGPAVVLVPGALLAAPPATLHAGANTRVFVALGAASLAEDSTPARMAWKRATASAQLLTDAMSRAGRGLTRETLLEALTNSYNVQTNLPLPLSFGPNRRVGANTVRIVMLDTHSGKFIPVQRGGNQR